MIADWPTEFLSDCFFIEMTGSSSNWLHHASDVAIIGLGRDRSATKELHALTRRKSNRFCEGIILWTHFLAR